MNEKRELNELCQKIKRMIPSNKIRNDATEPFTKFLISLREKGISEDEIDSIRRSYNYFNHIVSVHISNKVSNPNGSEISTVDDSSDKLILNEKKPKIPKGIYSLEASGEASETVSEVASDEAVEGNTKNGVIKSKQDPVLSDEKMIQLLLSLYELENKRMAIADMKTISNTVLKSIPTLNHEWTDKKIPKEKLNTLIGRLGYQAEVAKLLNELIPESDALLDATTHVLAIAQNEEAMANQNDTNKTLSSVNGTVESTGGTLASIKEKARITQQSITAKKLDEIVESLPKSIIEAQEKVIEEVTKLESNL